MLVHLVLTRAQLSVQQDAPALRIALAVLVYLVLAPAHKTDDANIAPISTIAPTPTISTGNKT